MNTYKNISLKKTSNYSEIFLKNFDLFCKNLNNTENSNKLWKTLETTENAKYRLKPIKTDRENLWELEHAFRLFQNLSNTTIILHGKIFFSEKYLNRIAFKYFWKVLKKVPEQKQIILLKSPDNLRKAMKKWNTLSDFTAPSRVCLAIDPLKPYF